MQKICKKCKNELYIESNFYKDRRIKGGYRGTCKICEGSIKTPPTHKFCNICNSEKELSEFSLRKNMCKYCYDIFRKNKKSENSKIYYNREIIHIIPESKICTKCNTEKEIKSFYTRKGSNDGCRNECTECFNASRIETRKIYRKKNKSILREKNKTYHKDRLKTDPLYRLKCTAKGIIRKSLSKKGYTKKSRTHEILGCSYDYFKSHIESLFLPEMDWQNRDLWHIDHIVPLSFAQTEEECLKLNHYSNLRPLWIYDNLSKSDTISETNEIYDVIIENRTRKNSYNYI